jgi:DNA-binding transcriptional regulator YhcF (GntR family)
MRTLSVDLNSEVPVYRQIALELRAQIAREVLAPGEELPSVRELGTRLGVNLNTVAKAYRLLADEGLVELRQGSAARVAVRGPIRQTAAKAQPDDHRLLRHVIGKWASRGLDRAAVEAGIRRVVDEFFGPPRQRART